MTTDDTVSIDKLTLIDDYQVRAAHTALQMPDGLNLMERSLGLAEEVSELYAQGGIARLLHDYARPATAEEIDEPKLRLLTAEAALAMMYKEAGDVLWYASQLATELGLTVSLCVREAALRSQMFGPAMDTAFERMWEPKRASVKYDAAQDDERQVRDASTEAYAFHLTFDDLRHITQRMKLTPNVWDGVLAPRRMPSRITPHTLHSTQQALDIMVQAQGVICGRVKKMLRDDFKRELEPDHKQTVARQIGIIWCALHRFTDGYRRCAIAALMGYVPIDSAETYASWCKEHLGQDGLAHVAQTNIVKLRDRHKRGKIKGDGDSR
jgi:hypothetical protein